MYSSKAGVPWSGTAFAAVAKAMAVTTAAIRGPITRLIFIPHGSYTGLLCIRSHSPPTQIVELALHVRACPGLGTGSGTHRLRSTRSKLIRCPPSSWSKIPRPTLCSSPTRSRYWSACCSTSRSLSKWRSRGREDRRPHGRLDAREIAEYDPEKFAALCSERPAVHRFPGSMAKRIQALSQIIVDRYDGDAAAGGPRATPTVRRCFRG